MNWPLKGHKLQHFLRCQSTRSSPLQSQAKLDSHCRATWLQISVARKVLYEHCMYTTIKLIWHMQLSSLSRSQTSYDFLLTSTDVLHHWVSGDSWELLLSLLSLSNISFPQNIIFPRVRPWITLLYSLCMFWLLGGAGKPVLMASCPLA